MAESFNPPCPHCGAAKVSDRKIFFVVSGLGIVIVSIVSLSLLLPIVTLLMGIGIVISGNMISENNRYKCKSCKETFGEPQDSEDDNES